MFNNPGNQYALKWTPESTLETLHSIEAEACKEETLYLTPALRALQLSRRVWPYWKHKFSTDDEILDLMDIIEGIFEAKLFEGALMGKIHASAAIFGLKHNHHWSERPEAKDSAPQTDKEAPKATPVTTREPAILKLSGGRVITLP